MRKQILLRCVFYKFQIRQGMYPLRYPPRLPSQNPRINVQRPRGNLPRPLSNSTIAFQVGGLPLVELNHLELQFLILNDFRLAVPMEELEAYGTMLVEFYARDLVAQQQQQQQAQSRSAIASSMSGLTGEEVYMRPSAGMSEAAPMDVNMQVGQAPTPP
jgi:hypothetical protein